MHFGFAHTLVVAALVSSIWLLWQGGDRLFPTLAAVAAGLEALIVFNIINLSSGQFRIDVILPALLLVAGGITWTKISTKGGITAATVATLVGAIQLLLALRVLS
jgi:hypothetical protein